MSTVTLPRALPIPSRETLLWGALLVNTEVLLVLAYLLFGRSRLLNLAALRLYLYPFVWINVSLWALVRVRPAPASTTQRALAGLIAGGYFLVLAVLGGLASLSGSSAFDVSPSLLSLPPGWGPNVSVEFAGVLVTIIPFKLLGYITLSYLVYTTVLEAAGALPAVLGLFSCVSCAWTAVVVPLSGVIGGTGALTAFVYAGGYDLSTVVFVLSVLLLVWRPTVVDRTGFGGGVE